MNRPDVVLGALGLPPADLRPVVRGRLRFEDETGRLVVGDLEAISPAGDLAIVKAEGLYHVVRRFAGGAA